MDGDIAPLKEITKLAQKYDATVFVDDCHATGFLGEGGRGTDEHCGVLGQVDVINSTLGKALGGGTGHFLQPLLHLYSTLSCTAVTSGCPCSCFLMLPNCLRASCSRELGLHQARSRNIRGSF